MVNPVQLNNNTGINFRGEENIFSAPSQFSVPPAAQPEADVVELSTKAPEEKSGGIGKTILKAVGGLLLLTVAAWGIYKGKGEKWINDKATTNTDKVKNILAKPGEWLDKNIVIPIKNRFTGKATAKAAKDGDAAATKPATEPKPAEAAPETKVEE